MSLINAFLEKQRKRESGKLADAIYRNNTIFQKNLNDQLRQIECETKKLTKSLETNTLTFQTQLRHKRKEWLKEQEKQSHKMYHYVYKYRDSSSSNNSKMQFMNSIIDEDGESVVSDLSDSSTIKCKIKSKRPILLVADFKKYVKQNKVEDKIKVPESKETLVNQNSSLKLSRSVSFREPSSMPLLKTKADTKSSLLTKNDEYKEALSQSFYLSKNVPKIVKSSSAPIDQKQSSVSHSPFENDKNFQKSNAKKELINLSAMRRTDSLTMSFVSLNESIKSHKQHQKQQHQQYNFITDKRYMNLVSTLECFN